MGPFLPHDLETTSDFVYYLVFAALLGAIAGLIGELLIGRGKSKQTGRLELPSRTARWLDFGSLASIPIGALAAVLSALVVAPVHEVTKGTESVTEYDALRLTLIALTAGLAGGGVLAKFQEGFTATITAARLEKALGAAETALAEIEEAAAGDAVVGADQAISASDTGKVMLAAAVTSAAQTARRQIQRALREEND